MNTGTAASVWSVYLIRTASGSLYCGVTTDVQRRYREHCQGGSKTAKALRGRGPLTLVFTHAAGDKRRAMQLEWTIKQWSKADKEALIEGRLRLPDRIVIE